MEAYLVYSYGLYSCGPLEAELVYSYGLHSCGPLEAEVVSVHPWSHTPHPESMTAAAVVHAAPLPSRLPEKARVRRPWQLQSGGGSRGMGGGSSCGCSDGNDVNSMVAVAAVAVAAA